MKKEEIIQKINDLAKASPWYQPVALGDGVNTRPELKDSIDWGIGKWNFFIKECLPDLTGKRVLDIGCNSGLYAIESIKSGAREAVGLDLRLDIIEKAIVVRDVLSFNDGVDYSKVVNYHVEDMETSDLTRHGKFDVTMLVSVIYHMSENGIDNMLKQLLKNTNFLLVQGVYRNDKYPARPEDIKKILEKTGFKDVNMYNKIDPNTKIIYDRPIITARGDFNGN